MGTRILLLGLLCMASYIMPARAFWPFDPAGIDYEIRIEGVSNEQNKAFDLEALAEQAIDEEHPPETVDALHIFNRLMAERVRAALAAHAYFDAKAYASIDEPDDEDDTPVIIITANTGEQYHIDSHQLHWKSAELAVEDKSIFPAHGTLADTAPLLASAEALSTQLSSKHCLLSLTISPRLILDKIAHKATIIYDIEHGGSANFGDTRFTGDSKVNESILRKRIKWKQGQCFSQNKLDKTQTSLLKTQLLSKAHITVGEQVNEEGEIPITIELKDRPHRTISAGVDYNRDDGAGFTIGWEHRNMLHDAHTLSTELHVSTQEQAASVQYSIPYFYRDDQKLNLDAGITRESTDTFDAQSILALASLDRKITPELLVGIGLGARFSRVIESGLNTENFGFLYVPVYAEWDSRDDSLDPMEGIYARASIAPYSDVTGQGISFIRTEGLARTYFTAEDWRWKPTLALRGNYGQINGTSVTALPADIRFYTGGGGSVRGYGYRSIGARNADDDPQGGTVWTELSSEIRLRFNDTIGAVAFMDAGTVYDGTAFDPSEELFLSAGLGMRYYSPIGPLRLDVGVPLNRGDDDSNFDIYISIGQAF